MFLSERSSNFTPSHRKPLRFLTYDDGETDRMETLNPNLRAPEAAKYLSLAESTLAKLRMGASGPAFYKIGKAVIYSRADLDAWLAAHRVCSEAA